MTGPVDLIDEFALAQIARLSITMDKEEPAGTSNAPSTCSWQPRSGFCELDAKKV